MDTLEAVKSRRAIKHYDPNFTIPDSEVKKLMEHVLLSPTSFNIQHWRFLQVQNPELRKKIRAAAWDQEKVTDASLLFVLCADVKAWDKDAKRYWQNAAPEIQEMMIPAIHNFYAGKERLQRDEAIRSVGIAAQTMMISAKAMGYDSCPMIGFDPDEVAKLIHLPEDHIIGMFVVVGKASKPAWSKSGQLPLNEVFFKDQF